MYNVSYGAEDSAGVLIGPDKGSSEQVKEWQGDLERIGDDALVERCVA